MDARLESALTAWKIDETEAEDAYAVLRMAFMKYVEGIGHCPADALIERSMRARLRMLASMKVAILAVQTASAQPATAAAR